MVLAGTKTVRHLSRSTKGILMEPIALILNGLTYFVIALLVLLHKPANRRAVKLVRAWRAPSRK